MKIGVLGSEGRLGSTLVSDYGYFPISVDITDIHELAKQLDYHNPDMVINCAAYTDVDGCEENTKKAYNVNFRGAANLARCYKKPIIHLSTDFIFNGKKGNYSEDASPDPLNYYGLTKWGAEQAIAMYSKDYTILRTTLLFGSRKKSDFVQRISAQLELGQPFKVTTALSGNPTYVRHLACAIDRLVYHADRPKIVNYVSSDIFSRYEFALMIADLFGYDKKLIYPTKYISGVAKRPRKAGLNTTLAKSLGLGILPTLTHLVDFKTDMKQWK